MFSLMSNAGKGVEQPELKPNLKMEKEMQKQREMRMMTLEVGAWENMLGSLCSLPSLQP